MRNTGITTQQTILSLLMAAYGCGLRLGGSALRLWAPLRTSGMSTLTAPRPTAAARATRMRSFPASQSKRSLLLIASGWFTHPSNKLKERIKYVSFKEQKRRVSMRI